MGTHAVYELIKAPNLTLWVSVSWCIRYRPVNRRRVFHIKHRTRIVSHDLSLVFYLARKIAFVHGGIVNVDELVHSLQIRKFVHGIPNQTNDHTRSYKIRCIVKINVIHQSFSVLVII